MHENAIVRLPDEFSYIREAAVTHGVFIAAQDLEAYSSRVPPPVLHQLVQVSSACVARGHIERIWSFCEASPLRTASVDMRGPIKGLCRLYDSLAEDGHVFAASMRAEPPPPQWDDFPTDLRWLIPLMEKYDVVADSPDLDIINFVRHSITTQQEQELLTCRDRLLSDESAMARLDEWMDQATKNDAVAVFRTMTFIGLLNEIAEPMPDAEGTDGADEGYDVSDDANSESELSTPASYHQLAEEAERTGSSLGAGGFYAPWELGGDKQSPQCLAQLVCNSSAKWSLRRDGTILLCNCPAETMREFGNLLSSLLTCVCECDSDGLAGTIWARILDVADGWQLADRCPHIAPILQVDFEAPSPAVRRAADELRRTLSSEFPHMDNNQGQRGTPLS